MSKYFRLFTLTFIFYLKHKETAVILLLQKSFFIDIYLGFLELEEDEFDGGLLDELFDELLGLVVVSGCR